jgi:hypothetical protein
MLLELYNILIKSYLTVKILGVIPGYVCLFESLNPIYFPESIEVGFKSRKYLSSDVDCKEGEEYLRKIFTGRLQPDKSR